MSLPPAILILAALFALLLTSCTTQSPYPGADPYQNTRYSRGAQVTPGAQNRNASLYGNTARANPGYQDRRSYSRDGAGYPMPPAPTSGYLGGLHRGGPQKRGTVKDSVSFWDGDSASGAAKIVIDISDQRAYFYKGSKIVGVSIISSGTDKYPTPTGTFKITQKSKDHRSNLYGDFVDKYENVVVREVESKDTPPPGTKFLGSKMSYFLRFNGGVGMHAGFLPGYPASHGCVRLADKMAPKFYGSAKYGTPVIVQR